MKAVDTHYWELLSSHLLQIKPGFKVLNLRWWLETSLSWLVPPQLKMPGRLETPTSGRPSANGWPALPLQDNFRSDAILAPERPLGSDRLSRRHLCLTSLALSSFLKPLTGPLLRALPQRITSAASRKPNLRIQAKEPGLRSLNITSPQLQTLNLCCGSGAAYIYCLCFSFISPSLVPTPDPTVERK